MVLFLSLAIFLLVITMVMPEGMTSIPVMSVYLLLECMISTVIMLITIVQLRLHNQGDDTPLNPSLKTFTKTVTNFRNKLFCSSNDDSRGRRKQSARNTDSRATSVMFERRAAYLRSTQRVPTTRSTQSLTSPTALPHAYNDVTSDKNARSQSAFVGSSIPTRVENEEQELKSQ
ncbi:hypothetical protein DPMN_166136 [Dreissena polymorpha]|uniref:Neurotransmitter-gated ion-channel transmembrane domain-containing protein n=1 Tax=Dreissena polymorpha TaxID=45954 RepID=A0A9D4EYX0_DREPO|nr:hypothetical protein DPMN_166136 [Dreissena polymorpha]